MDGELMVEGGNELNASEAKKLLTRKDVGTKANSKPTFTIEWVVQLIRQVSSVKCN